MSGMQTPESGRSREGFLARGLRVSWPHLVLLAVYLCYLGIGGWIFLAIEGGSQPDVSRELDRYEALKARMDGAVRNLTEEGRRSSAANLTDVWEEFKALVEGPYLDDLTHFSRVDWTFTGSVLFCATSIATIGYGDAVPVTTWGRVVIVIYSLIGIPLTLTFLADIGGLLARVVVLLAGRARCGRRDRGPRSPPPPAVGPPPVPGSVRAEPVRRPNGLSARLAGAWASGARERVEERGDVAEMRFSLGVFKDGAGPVRGSQPNSRRGSADAESPPETPDPRKIVNTVSEMANPAFAPDDAVREEVKMTLGSPDTSATVTATDDDDDDDDTGMAPRHVPVVLVVAILLIYTLLGALMIAYVEGWHYGEALYFTFITLTTIGFGDFVPVKHYMDIPSFVGCLVYTIVGLSVMSMCISLVQAKVVGFMSRMAGKIGF